MWRNEDLYESLVPSVLGLFGVAPPEAPADFGRVAARGRGRRPHAGPPPGVAAHARHRVHELAPGALRGRRDRHAGVAQLRRPRALARGRATSTSPRWRSSATRSASRWCGRSRRPRRTTRRTTCRALGLVISSGVMWTAEIKQALMARGGVPLPGLARIERGRRLRAADQRARRGGDDGEVLDRRPHQGAHRGRARGRARLGRAWAARPRRPDPARVLQGPREVGGDVPHLRRQAVLGPGRLGEGRGRRHHRAPRPRQRVDQLGRREDLPRGGRGGGEEAPGRAGRDRRRHPRRQVRRGDHRGGVVPAGRDRDARTRSSRR